MNKLFIDTSGWASLFVTQELFHDRTSQLFNQAIQKRHTLITSNYILSELVALLHSPLRQLRYCIFEIVDAIRKTSYRIHLTF
jgi:predicted nucleic acid-binding protein